MNHSFAVCDLKQGFADRFAGFVNKRRLCPYLMESFTDVNLLEEYGKKHCIEVLLIDELLYTDRIKNLNIGQVFLLTEDQIHVQTAEGNRLYKFLSIPEIMNAVMLDFADRNKNYMSTTVGKKVKIIGGFTPATHIGHTSFILTLALKTAEKRKAFYLNISSTYGFLKMLNKMSCYDLSDVMYCIKNGNYMPDEWPKEVFFDYGNLKMILPATPVSDLQCINEEDWIRLLEIIGEMDVDYIFLDIDESTAACFSLLDRCDLIYSAGTDDYTSKVAFEEFEELLSKMGMSALCEKIRKVYPPADKIQEKPLDYFEALKSGPMGEYVSEVFT